MRSATTTPALIPPFFQAAREVLEQELGLDAAPGPIQALDLGDLPGDDATVLVAITGDLEGTAFYRYSLPCALGIVSRIIGSPMTELDELARSGIAELGNVITGRAGVLLADQGWTCTIAPPVVVAGQAVRVHAPYRPVWQSAMSTPFGAVIVSIAVRPVRPAAAVDGVFQPERG
ncbi:MAG TPA: chemotaxis protein CheX [Isosphaeraceae bacterium]|nr:chemotaxis protein CheX [Isosphaeraceae bacterium]